MHLDDLKCIIIVYFAVHVDRRTIDMIIDQPGMTPSDNVMFPPHSINPIYAHIRTIEDVIPVVP